MARGLVIRSETSMSTLVVLQKRSISNVGSPLPQLHIYSIYSHYDIIHCPLGDISLTNSTN